MTISNKFSKWEITHNQRLVIIFKDTLKTLLILSKPKKMT